MLQGQDREDGFNSSGSSQCMSGKGFGGAESWWIPSEKAFECPALRKVIILCAGSMETDVIDILYG